MKIKRIYLESATDRCGKTTLKSKLEKATNFKYHIVDRSTISNRTYDIRYNRTENDSSNYDYLEDLDRDVSVVVYLYAHPDVIQERINRTNHEQIDIEKDMAASFKALQQTHYKNIIKIDTSFRSVESEVETVILCIKQLEEQDD